MLGKVFKKNQDVKIRYGLRKLSVGLVSVMLSMTIFYGAVSQTSVNLSLITAANAEDTQPTSTTAIAQPESGATAQPENMNAPINMENKVKNVKGAWAEVFTWGGKGVELEKADIVSLKPLSDEFVEKKNEKKMYRQRWELTIKPNEAYEVNENDSFKVNIFMSKNITVDGNLKFTADGKTVDIEQKTKYWNENTNISFSDKINVSTILHSLDGTVVEDNNGESNNKNINEVKSYNPGDIWFAYDGDKKGRNVTWNSSQGNIFLGFAINSATKMDSKTNVEDIVNKFKSENDNIPSFIGTANEYGVLNDSKVGTTLSFQIEDKENKEIKIEFTTLRENTEVNPLETFISVGYCYVYTKKDRDSNSDIIKYEVENTKVSYDNLFYTYALLKDPKINSTVGDENEILISDIDLNAKKIVLSVIDKNEKDDKDAKEVITLTNNDGNWYADSEAYIVKTDENEIIIKPAVGHQNDFENIFKDKKVIMVESNGIDDEKYLLNKKEASVVTEFKEKKKKKKSNLNTTQRQIITNSRISGINRVETAVDVSKKLYPKGTDTVVIANYDKYTDSLVTPAYLKMLNAPLLFTGINSTPEQTIKEIKRLNATKVIIVGGVNSVSKEVEAILAKDHKIDRIDGKDRYDTAKIIADRIMEKNGNKGIIIASGEKFPDALSISSLSVKNNMPILLTKSNKIPKYTKSILEGLNDINSVYLVGGANTIYPSVENSIKDITKKNITKFAGSNRYETSAIIAEKVMPSSSNVITASGEVFPDALLSGSLVDMYNAPVLLVKQNSLPSSISQYFKNSSIINNIVVGGVNTISNNVLSEIEKVK